MCKRIRYSRNYKCVAYYLTSDANPTLQIPGKHRLKPLTEKPLSPMQCYVANNKNVACCRCLKSIIFHTTSNFKIAYSYVIGDILACRKCHVTNKSCRLPHMITLNYTVSIKVFFHLYDDFNTFKNKNAAFFNYIDPYCDSWLIVDFLDSRTLKRAIE